MQLSTFFQVSFICLELVAPVITWTLQACLNGTVEQTHSARCKYGIWFSKPEVVHQICVENGIWAVYQDFCDPSPLIWTVHPGRKGCMTHNELGKRILGVVPLGHDEYGAIMSTSDRKLFFNNHKLKHGMRLNFLNGPATVEVLTWGPPSYSFSIQQFVGNKILQQCLIKGRDTFFGYYKIQLESYQNVSVFLAKNICTHPKSSVDGTRVQVLPSEIDFDIVQSSSEDNDMSSCKRYVKYDEPFMPDDYEIDLVASHETGSDGIGQLHSKEMTRIIEKRVDKETQQIVMKLLAHHFNSDKIQMGFEQWEFLLIAKQIFLKVCPSHMVPEFFIEQIHLLFQAVLRQSFRLFPYKIAKDLDARARIITALQSCLSNSTKFQFKQAPMCTKDVPLLKKEFDNGTKIHLLVDMPSFIKIDVVNFDLVMESIWKLMNFAHYYCTDSYKEYYSDHSLLEGHWYGLFSPQVIRRWKYPGRSYRVMQQVFKSIDLEQSVKNLDFCVSAARLHSSYKGWLKRPLSHWDKVRQLDTIKGGKSIWGGQAHCMDDYMYPAFKLGYPIEKCGIRLPSLNRPFV